MIEVVAFFLLAFSIRQPLQTSTFQAGSRTGAEMTIFEKIDTHRHRRDLDLCKAVSQPDATGFSGVVPDEAEAKPCAFFADDIEEDSLEAKSAPIAKSTGNTAAQEPTISKDKRA